MNKNYNQKGGVSMLVIGIIVALTFAGTLLSYLTKSSTQTQTTPPLYEEPLSTLACQGDGAQSAMDSILTAYETGGDVAAFQLADTYISDGVCAYNPDSLKWIGKEYADDFGAEFQPYVEVSCRQLSNGHCVSVQPVFGTDETDEEIVWTGYMLTEPRIPDGAIPPQKTEASRLVRGLILDQNY